MPNWTQQDGLRWRALPAFGVEIDYDLSTTLPPSTAARFVALLREYGLIVARRQALSMAQQTALMLLIGPIVLRPWENGYISTEADSQASRAELSFHADAAYTDAPFAALSLHAVDVVDGASATRFAGAEQAYDTLPARLRDRLDMLCADMISPGMDGIAGRACDAPDAEATARARLPAIRVNPRTGRRYVGVSEMHTARLLDVAQEEGRALLDAVFAHLYASSNVIEHLWQSGDLLVWDNLTFQHARGSLASVGRRVLQRVVAGVPEHADQDSCANAATVH